jgi:hypothetical protein
MGKEKKMHTQARILRQQIVAAVNIVLLLAFGPGATRIATAQQSDAPPPAMAPDQLDQLVAPIALYPDPLLAQVLAASTFPIDVVQADRWAQQHKNLKGQQLTDAVVQANLPYDPSIISLIQFPTVLTKLSQELDWTTSLGNIFLTQRGDVMDAVQRMRRKAEKMGKLKSSEHVQVVSNPTVIEIQPANPQVIYVPAYNPQVVYVQPPPPPGPSTGAVVATGLISFGLGVAVGAAASNNGCCWYGGSVGWSSHTVVVANNSFNRTWATRGAIPPPPPYYRSGGPYPAGRAPVTVNNVNVNNVNRNTANVNNVNRNTANVNNVNRNTATMNSGNVNSGNVNSANRTAPAGGAAANPGGRSGGWNPGSANRGYSEPSAARQSSAFSGAQNGNSERAASERGQATRGSRRK